VRILQTISTEINSTLELEQIFERILSSLDSAFGFRHAMILVPDSGAARLRVVASRGYAEAGLGATIEMGQGVVGVVAKKRRFMPRELLEILGKKSILEVKLGDQLQREMAILFSDIRSFTSISEKMLPKENFDFINAFLCEVAPVIRESRGFIDKYIGDAIMALFAGDADDAVRAGIDMQRRLRAFNE